MSKRSLQRAIVPGSTWGDKAKEEKLMLDHQDVFNQHKESVRQIESDFILDSDRQTRSGDS